LVSSEAFFVGISYPQFSLPSLLTTLDYGRTVVTIMEESIVTFNDKAIGSQDLNHLVADMKELIKKCFQVAPHIFSFWVFFLVSLFFLFFLLFSFSYIGE